MKNLSLSVNFHDCQVTEEYLAIFKKQFVSELVLQLKTHEFCWRQLAEVK